MFSFIDFPPVLVYQQHSPNLFSYFTTLKISMTLVGRYKVDYRILCKNTFVSLGVGLAGPVN